MIRGDDSRRGNRIFSRAALVGAVVGALALGGMATAVAATGSHATTKTTVLTSFKGKRGWQLVVVMNGQKLTLYNFSRDPLGGPSKCYNRCAKTWYPLIDHGKITVINRKCGNHCVSRKHIKTVRRRTGGLQIMYYGQPLYRCRRNKRTGQDYGADSFQFGGSWGIMGVQGSALTSGSYNGGKQPPAC